MLAKELWRSLRPNHWIKNLALFAGIIFSRNILHLSLLFKVILASFVLCLLSGCGYILNDLFDLKQDRRHPIKSHRPLASGRLKVSHALLALIVFIPSLLGIAYYLNPTFFLVALSYLLLQVVYSFLLKHIVIIDVFAIAGGFVLRVVAGAVVIGVMVSSWLLICTILLALFLGLSKRRHELVVLQGEAQNHRRVLGEYSPYLLDQMIALVTTSTVIAYTLYTIDEGTIARFGTKNLIFTIPFVLYGILRYLYLIHQREAGGNPESILVADKPLLINIFLWALMVGVILYG